jgi:very-short-patch-repair endonuclease
MLAQHKKDIDAFLASIPSRSVRTLLATDVRSATALIFESPCAARPARMIVSSFPRTLALDETIDSTVRAMAELIRGDGALKDCPNIHERWAQMARKKLGRGELPLSTMLARETQAEQLALALGRELLLVLSIEEEAAEGSHIYSFARAAEWLAEKTGARTAVVVPSSFAERTELDPIFYGAARLQHALLSAEQPAPIFRAHAQIGRPHPFSEAEQKLAKAIALDRELLAKLELNQSVETRRHTRYLVDVLWREGRLIIEVDGWETHGNRATFETDRHRDYELSLSNYLVLRITNEEIMEDVQLALEKIRDAVRFRTIGEMR